MSRKVSLLLIVVFFLLAAAPIMAQRRPRATTPRNDTGPTIIEPRRKAELVVDIVYPNGWPVGRAVHVQLAVAGMSVADAFTDDLGKVRFSNLDPGSYKVKAIGGSFEDTTSETFEISSFGGFHRETLTVQPSKDASGQPVSTEAMVAVAELNVPGKARKEFDKGNDAIDRGNMPKALEHFTKAIQIYPQYAKAFNNLGLLYLRSGDFANARDAFEKASSLDDRLSRPLVNLARIRLLERNFHEAELLLDRALSLEPKAVDAMALMSQADLEQGKFDDAIEDQQKVHLMPHTGLAFVHLVAARAFELKNQLHQAVEQYKLFLAEAPNDKNAPRIREALARFESASSQ